MSVCPYRHSVGYSSGCPCSRFSVTQSVSLSATLPFIRSDIRSYIQPGIRLSACPAVQPFDRLAV
ncbi:hypothetical protein [Bacteroides thetaiotaomicron]|uniref:hypothetical protein n=1 Tax=Bacteroides thetaiotaomicron TaxID=818 RepID=UPI001F1A4C36|nr:hypothetical protein [Bacteroides thetaiotaomicron]